MYFVKFDYINSMFRKKGIKQQTKDQVGKNIKKNMETIVNKSN